VTSEHPIWLYDGVCVLCSGAVQYVLKHERHHTMRFITIQSAAGRALAIQHGIDPDQPDSFLFVDGGRALAKSDGVMALAHHVNGAARLLLLGRILPKVFRDWLYDRLAQNRYRLFGKRDTCAMPDATSRHRFTL
jgi:predicted DCC family thiol-disulfide oxidoreductase YuxK